MVETLRKYYNDDYFNQVADAANDYPKGLLGPKFVEEGYLISAMNPLAKSIKVLDKTNDCSYEMTKIDERGIFSVLVDTDKEIDYVFEVTTYDDNTYEIEDIYSFPAQFSDIDAYLFGNGTHYEIHKKLGAHKTTINGVDGVLFAVWAPNALRISVVGSFNNWDGRIYQMNKVHDMGIYELFAPRADVNDMYKFEIFTRQGWMLTKTDPFGNWQELRPGTASKVADIESYTWNDNDWTTARATKNNDKSPMSIYEVHLGSWKKKDDGSFYNYRELAQMLGDYVEEMGYTHIELMGISEHPFDGSWGYQVTGYFAPTSRFGAPDDFMYFVDYMHQKNIGVILDWVPAHFPKDAHGLARFDGHCLYEHLDPRRGEHPHWGTYIFNYTKNEVRNFLICSALMWLEQFHIDGLRVDAVASMLYLDYGKEDGNWCPNMYGGRENLEAVELIKHLNSIVSQRVPGAMVIAEESTAWPGVTADVTNNGLGFSYKWNMGWMNDFLQYISKDPIYRKYEHNKLTFSMMYAYTEKFILPFSHDEVVHGKQSLIKKMPGYDEDKFGNLRTAYGFMFGHPGKKLLFMGQEFAQWDEWNDAQALEWYQLEFERNKKMQDYTKALLHFYKEYPCLYEEDFNPSGFEWMNCDDAESSVVSFVRKTQSGKRNLLFFCNFTTVTREDYRVCVPNSGLYKQVFTSDKVEFGGYGVKENGTVKADKQEWGGRDYSIAVTLPPLSVVIFEYNTPNAVKKEKTSKPEKTVEKVTDTIKDDEVVEKVTETVEEKSNKKSTNKKSNKKAKKAEKQVEETTIKMSEVIENAQSKDDEEK